MYQPAPVYNPYMQQQYSQMMNRMQNIPYQYQQTSNFQIVNNKESADAYYIPPNSQVILMDKELPRIYLKETDAAGEPTVTAYTISEVQDEKIDEQSLYVTREEFEEWKRSLTNESFNQTNEPGVQKEECGESDDSTCTVTEF